jgi:hypothetical protein
VPIAAAAIILWLLTTLAMREMVATLVFVLVAGIVYTLRHTMAKPAPRMPDAG